MDQQFPFNLYWMILKDPVFNIFKENPEDVWGE